MDGHVFTSYFFHATLSIGGGSVVRVSSNHRDAGSNLTSPGVGIEVS